MNCWVEAGVRLADFADTSKPEFDVNSTVADMTMEDGGWNFELLENMLQPEMVDLAAGTTPPRPNRGDDDWIWGLEDSGQFTIKSAYNLICQTEEIPNLAIWKMIWRWDGPNRIRHFLCLAARNRLLTNESRKHRGMSQVASCELCQNADESVSHVLRDCSFAREAWRATRLDDIDEPDWQMPLTEWLERHLKSEKGLQFGVMCWHLWRSRNERLFAGGRDKPEAVAIKAAHSLSTIREAVCRETILDATVGRKRMIEVCWQAGPQDWVTLNTDGSVRGPQGRAAAGGIFRASSGNCLHAYTADDTRFDVIISLI
ncbi:Putative ribonuclease H protein At1g65750 [Linum perenne]